MTAIDGLIVVDKPAGLTSAQVVGRVRRALGGRKGPKVGHAGTLDPDATGILLLAVGRATRLVPYVQQGRKVYRARMRLGQETTTLDAAGQVTRTRDPSAVDERSLRAVLAGFVGEVEQIPPMVSAVKVGGERLYAKARRGETVPRAVRRVTVYDLSVDSFVPGPLAEAVFTVTCSAGTYVRTLAADAGERLGVGAHLVALRRLASGRFGEDDAHTLDEVVALAERGRVRDVLVPGADAVADYPRIIASDADAGGLRHGSPLGPTGLDGPVAVVDATGRLLGMVADSRGAARPLVVVAPVDD